MMTTEDISTVGRTLSWLLRHGANESGLAMDVAGWALVDDVLRIVKSSREVLDIVVAENNKSRYELQGDKIRASQGHSLAGTPVTHEALEASWEVHIGTDTIWHGTNLAALASIAKEGLLPGERTHVHLAEETTSKVGKRANVDVLLGIDPNKLRAQGFGIYQSANGVIFARQVPPACFVALLPQTKKSQAQEAQLLAMFGFASKEHHD